MREVECCWSLDIRVKQIFSPRAQSVNELNTTVLLRTQTMDTVVIITAYCAFRYEWGKNTNCCLPPVWSPVEVIGRMFKFVNKKNQRAFLVRWSPVKSFPHKLFHPCDRLYQCFRSLSRKFSPLPGYVMSPPIRLHLNGCTGTIGLPARANRNPPEPNAVPGWIIKEVFILRQSMQKESTVPGKLLDFFSKTPNTRIES